MGKNVFDLRFGVQRDDGYKSSVWRLWITQPRDVYLATRSMAGIKKYSFHRSGICRDAFTKGHGTPRTMNDRAMSKWNRASTPPSGSGRASRVTSWLAFPTDYLSRLNNQERKKMLWLPAAPSGSATFVEMAFTNESEAAVCTALKTAQRSLISFTEISDTEAFFTFSYSGEWQNSDLRSPAAPDSSFPDLLFSKDDPAETGRPVRICIASQPNDGDCVLIQELGGYRAR